MKKLDQNKKLHQNRPQKGGSKITKKSQKRENSHKASHSKKKPSQIRQNAEKLQRYIRKLKNKKTGVQEEEKKVESISPSHILECNQALSKQRKNIDPLIKYLLSHKYYEQDSGRLPTEPVLNEFLDFSHYHKIFYPLMLNEYVAEIENNLETLIDQAHKILPIACQVRICQGDADIDEDFTCLEIRIIEDKSHDCLVMAQEGHKINEIFDLSFSSHYLLLISSSSEGVSMDQINTGSPGESFSMMGYLNNSQGRRGMIKILTMAQTLSLQDCFKMTEEWTTCYVRPIQKISTAIKEYQALNCLVNSDVSQYIFQPKNVANIPSPSNEGFYSEFMEAIAQKYNTSQLEAIKDVCVSRNGICLLQGPPGTGKTHALVGIVSGIYHFIKNSPGSHRKYIMICAPSNTAIDEIIFRIQSEGLYGKDKTRINPKIVRIGILTEDSHKLIRNCSLEILAEKEVNKTEEGEGEKERPEARIDDLRDQIAKVSRKIHKKKGDPECEKKVLDEFYDKQRTLYAEYQTCKMAQEARKAKYYEMMDCILETADIICCTLGSAGSERLERLRNMIEAVIVDEASQCTEPSNIIPLQYSPNKLVLIGDPMQLPATTFSTDIESTKFSRTLFERIVDGGVKPFFLREQYRMTRSIRKFPSVQFYENRLLDAKSLQKRKIPKYLKGLESKNIWFIDLKFSKESISQQHSYYNTSEIEMCEKIIGVLLKRLEGEKDKKDNIGCISPYKKQVLMLKESLKKRYKREYKKCVAVNTVDSFQGKEKDIVVFSAVRSSKEIGERSPGGNLIGFLEDVRRLNVAITRPKYVLIVIGKKLLENEGDNFLKGNARTLATNETWSYLIDYFIKNKSYIGLDKEEDMEEAIDVIFKGKDLSEATGKPPELLVKMEEIPQSPKIKQSEELLHKRRLESSDEIEEGEKPEKKIKKQEEDASSKRLKSLFSQEKEEEPEMEKMNKKFNEESLVNQILDINRS